MNNRGNIANVSWNNGIHLLRINMVELTGLHATEIFGMMDAARSGTVTWKQWKHFFEALQSGDLAELLEKAKGLGSQDCLAERSSGKKKALRQLRAQQSGKLG